MKVLFIGGSGNISAAASRLARARGIDLFVLNRGQRGGDSGGARQLVADARDAQELARVLAGQSWDAVVDFIAFTPDDIERDLAVFAGKTRQFVFISSASAYQKPPLHPVISESTPLYNPFWEYSRNKIACEDRLLRAYREGGFPIVIVRPSLTYDSVIPVPLGGWQDFTVVDRLRRGLPVVVHGDGTSLWTVTHADDVARGLVGLLGNPESIGQAFHITSDEVLTWNQIYEYVAAAAGAEPRLVHVASELIARISPDHRGSLLGDKAYSVLFDNSKIRRFVPDYRATIPFRDGIRRTIAWFDEKPERRKLDPKNDALLERLVRAAEG